MSNQITLPSLGENIESGDVLSIFVSEGDTIARDQDLLEVETDKATMPIPSPKAGKVTKILVSEGDTVSVGAAILEFEPSEQSADEPSHDEASDEGEEAAEQEPDEKPPAETADDDEEETSEESAEPKAKSKTESKPAPKAERKTEPRREPQDDSVATADEEDVPGDGHSAAAAGPAVRRMARQLGVDLRRVRPSGEGGRITTDDVQSHVRATNQQATAAQPKGRTPPGSPDSDGYGAVRVAKMSRLRQTIARTMTESYTTIPQLTNFDDVDVTELEEIREQSKSDYAARGLKLTQMPFLIKAVASSLRLHPVLNASIDVENNQTIYKEYVNIGIAVDTERGLIVPVMRDADRLSIAQIAQELGRMANAAREGTFSLEELRGGTFTISNLGAVGGTYSTPIINPPEVAILLAGRSRTMPLYVDGMLEPRLVMPLSITYDHRVVDGAAAARFLNDVKAFLAAPGRLLLAP